MQKVPRRCTAEAVLKEIGSCVDLEDCCLLHLPWDLKRLSNIGFAFISFSSPEAAQRCFQAMSCRTWSSGRKHEVIRIVPARVQGVAANLREFVQNANDGRMFHPPFAPYVFSQGTRLELTEAIRMHFDSPLSEEMVQKVACGLQATESGLLGDTAPSVTSECVRKFWSTSMRDAPHMSCSVAPLDIPSCCANVYRHMVSIATPAWTCDERHCTREDSGNEGSIWSGPSTPPWPSGLLSFCERRGGETGHRMKVFFL